LTFSRGGWLLSLPAALLTIGLLRGRRATLLALLVLAIVLSAMVPLLGTRRLASLFDVEQGTTFRRLRLWEAAVAMLRDHPLTGVGLDNFLYQYPDYMLSDAWQEPGLSHPHNILLDWWLSLGIAGVVVLVWSVVAFFATALRLYRRLADSDARAMTLGLGASMAAALVHGLIDNSYFLVDLAFIFFFSLGWVRALSLQSCGEPARGEGAAVKRDVPA
jgi:putative inorganic carbon (HCO3(-)) transporter